MDCIAGKLWDQLNDDVVPMSRKTLREIFKDTDPSRLPADLAACLATGSQANVALCSASNDHDQQLSAHTRPQTIPRIEATPCSATKDPDTRQVTGQPGQPNTQSPPLTSQLATVHRTQLRTAPGQGVQPDLSLQVCPNSAAPHQPTLARANWDPQLLFPELSAIPTQHSTDALIAERSNPKKPLRSAQPSAPNLLLRTARGRIAKKNTSRTTPRNLDPQAFVDIPLQYEEGQKILQMIGVGHLEIPENLMDPNENNPRAVHTQQAVATRQAATSSKPISSKGKPKDKVLRPKARPPPKARLPLVQKPTPRKGAPTAGPSALSAPQASSASPQAPLAPPQAHSAPMPSQSDLPLQAHSDNPTATEGQRLSTTTVQNLKDSPDGSLPEESDTPTGSDDEHDDPYLDRVDYSDEDYAP